MHVDEINLQAQQACTRTRHLLPINHCQGLNSLALHHARRAPGLVYGSASGWGGTPRSVPTLDAAGRAQGSPVPCRA
eukprot:363736-Chlamydomonas_euryale.AAC.10